MKNLKKYQSLLIIIGIILIVTGLVWINRKPKMILFYSNSCSHCKVVEEYISANNVKAKFQFQELEVSQNQANAVLLEQKAKQCGLDTSQGLGVPFFFDGEKCLSGDQDIINYFQK